jgi:hypothetical protein
MPKAAILRSDEQRDDKAEFPGSFFPMYSMYFPTGYHRYYYTGTITPWRPTRLPCQGRELSQVLQTCCCASFLLLLAPINLGRPLFASLLSKSPILRQGNFSVFDDYCITAFLRDEGR